MKMDRIMIKHRVLSLICMLLCVSGLFAQVSVSVQRKQNPLPAQGGIYLNDPGRFFNIVVTNNSATEFLPVRLEARIEGPIENAVDIWPNGDSYLATMASRTMPIYIPLQPGQSRVLTQTDLYNMFRQYDAGTEVYSSGVLNEVFQGGVSSGSFGLLPEGHYGLKITAKTNFTDFNDPGDFLGEGVCYFDICYNANPPSFNNITYINDGNSGSSDFVEDNGFYTAYFPTFNPRFSWTEPTFNNAGLTVTRQFIYDFCIYQLSEDQYPSDAVLHNGNIAFSQYGLMTPQCIVPYNVVAKLKRYKNVKYVAQVTARPLVNDASNPNYTQIGNDGKSEMVVLLMENDGQGQDNDIVVDNPAIDLPINVTVEPKFTELPSAMYPYFENPSELFNVTLENKSSEAIPVCMLMQYYKGNWGVTAAPDRQHKNEYIEIPAGEKITLSAEDFDRLAGGYDFDLDVIAFKAKTGFVIGKPTSEYFTEELDTAFVRVCRYTGGKPVLRETIIGKGRTPFRTSPNVISGEMFNITLEPKMPVLPGSGSHYFDKPSRLFTLKIKSLSPKAMRIFPTLIYFVDDEVAYSGEYLKGKRLADNYITLKPNETKTFTDEEFDKFFGGFEEFKKTLKGGESELLDDFSQIAMAEGSGNVAKLYLFDYERLSMLDLEKDNISSAMLMEYGTTFNASSSVKLGDVDIVINPRVNPFPYNGDVYINSPGRIFEIELTNLTNKDLKLTPCISYADRNIDGDSYSYIASKWNTKPEFVLKAKEKKILDRETLNKLCGDTVAIRINHETGEKENDFKDFDEIISLLDENHLKFTLMNADSLRALSADADDYENRVHVATQALDFWASDEVVLTDLDVTISLKANPMPYNARAYFTKPEQLFEVSLSNVGDKTLEFVPMIMYGFNDDDKVTYLSNTFKDKELKHVLIEPGKTVELDEKQIKLYFASKGFTKITSGDNGEVADKEDVDIFSVDKDITIDPESFNKVTFMGLKPIIQNGGGQLSDYKIGEGNIRFQVSPLVRLDDVTVTVTPKLDPLPAKGNLYFESPAALFEVELKNNTPNTYNVLPNIMYLFDEFGSYYASVFNEPRYDKAIKLGPNEVKKLTSDELNAICGMPDSVKCFEARIGGNFVETAIPDINKVVNLQSFNQIEIVAYSADSLKSIDVNEKNRNARAMLGGGKSDFNAKEMDFSEVVVTVAPKKDATFKPDPEEYFEKPGDLFEVTLLNVTGKEQKVGLRLTYNDRYFISKPDSVITVKPDEKLKLSAARLNGLCGHDMYSYGAPLFEADTLGMVKPEKPDPLEIKMKEGDNKITALVWRKIIEDKENPSVYKVDSVSVCDTVFQPALRDLWIGEYRLTLTEAKKVDIKDKELKEKGYDCFKGKGYVHTTMMQVPVRVAVEFDSIYVDSSIKRVVKNGVKTITEKSAHVPLDLFEENFVKELAKSDSINAEAKVEALLKESGVGAFYNYVVGNAMQTLAKVDSAAIVTLPIGLSVPMDKEMECPATIQLAQMEFLPESANLDLIGEFVLPECEAIESEILIFAARKLSTSPESFLPQSGSLGLVKSFKVKDPESDFTFTFNAPTNQDYSKATDGCFISWKDGKFHELCASISMNLPSDELIKDNGKAALDPNVHPEITLTAFIADAEDWFATVKMDPFQVASAPGFTFSAVGDSVGIVLDRSKKRTPAGIKFPENYKFDGKLGLSADPGKNEKAYNEWQGFYFEELSCKLPHFVELDSEGDSRVKVAVKSVIYDASGFSMTASVDSLFTYGTPKLGGWKITLDNIYLNIKQNGFGSSGLSGRVEVPFLCKKDTTEKAQIGYLADIKSVAHGKKDGLAVNFKMQQIDDEVALDFMLAKVKFNKDSTYFNVIYCDTLPENKRTLVELCLDGKVSITCLEDIDFKLPDIPFKNMRIANFDQSLLTGKKDDKKDDKNKKKETGKGVTSPDGETNFHTGKWALAGDPGSDEGSFWGGMPFVLESISMKVGDGAETIGLGIEGGIVVMGNKKFGLGATVGLTIWSEIDWEELTIKYKEVEFEKAHIEGQFAGMVSVVGDLEVSDEEEKSGFDADLDVTVKGLFDIKLSGGYYKVKKTEEELELDDPEDRNDEYYHAGYFLAKAGFGVGLPLGPVSLKEISGGLFINYSVGLSDVEGSDNMIDALEENLKPKYKSYGGMFGVGLAVGDETFINGKASLLLMVDIQKDGIRVPGVMLQGEVHALCASADAESGLINGKVTILYEDTTTPDITDEEKATMDASELKEKLAAKNKEHKLFRLSVTVDSDIAAMYKKFTGEEYQVKAPVSDLQALDQKNADSENQGEKKNDSSSSGKLESKGYVKSGCGASINMELEIRNYPSLNKTYWHLYVGEPDESKRCRVTFIDFEVGKDSPVGLWAKVYANMYLCIGNELPGNGQLPAIPDKVQEALGMKGADGKVDASQKTKLDAAREQTMKGGPAGDINGGIMIGAALGAEIGCNAVFCYANVEGMLGFDLILKQYKEGVKCTDGTRAGGKNGFYATGQIYAMLKGELGLMLDLWIFKGKVPLVDMTIGALLQGGFPNPTWVYGRLRAKGSVLGGLIKFSSTIEMKAGKVCVPEMGNPLDDIKIFGDIQPGDEDIEKGWSEKSLVSCYGKSTFTTNMKIDKVLTLVDEGATMREDGMNGDGSQITRKYVFHLDNNFKMNKYDDSDPTDDERTSISTNVTHANPTFDRENYEIVTGSLEPNTLYRIKLRGTCKEIVNGDEVDPIYRDSLSNYKDVHRPFADERYVYFRTGELSDDINKEVVGYLPNKSEFTQTLENATQPSIMEQHVRDDYWNNPDHEFVASIKEYDEATGMYVLPDARQGLRKGQVSKYDNLPVVEIVEQGYDDEGKEFKYATVTLEKPVPGEHFIKDKTYRFEIKRINRAQLDNYMDMIEENYKSIMAMTKDDVDAYEQQLAEMDEAIAEGDAKAGDKQVNQAIRDLYNYYKEVGEMYGENEAEQRIKEYKEELKSNAQGFAEVVYTKDYTYNGVATFQDFMAKGGRDRWEKNYSKGNPVDYSSLYCKVEDVEMTGRDSRSTNPYYALNFWHSQAAITYNRTPKYDFCKYPFNRCKVGAMEGNEISTGVTFEPGYEWLRNRITNSAATVSDATYDYYYNPKHNTKWYRYDDIEGVDVFGDIFNAYQSDAYTAMHFEKEIKYYYNYYELGKGDANFDAAAENGHILKADKMDDSWRINYKAYAVMPMWQLGLIYAADHPHKYGLNEANCGRLATYAYKYMNGDWDIFSAWNFLKRIKKITVKVRFCDGYNIAAVTGNGSTVNKYGTRPVTSAKRTVVMSEKVDLKEVWNGWESVTYFNFGDTEVENEEFVHIGDKVMLEYILKYYDTNKDGKMHIDEMNKITTLTLDFDNIYIYQGGTRPSSPSKKVYIHSLDALKNMPNLRSLYLYNNAASTHNDFRENTPSLSFESNPKLSYVLMNRWYVDKLDFGSNSELVTLKIDMREKNDATEDKKAAVNLDTHKHKGVSFLNVKGCEKLTTLHVVDCDLTSIDLSGNKSIEEIDLRMNHLESLDISASYKLKEEDIKVGYQVKTRAAVGERIAYHLIQYDVYTFNLYKRIVDYKSPNHYVDFKINRGGQLDSNLYKRLNELAKEAGESMEEWSVKQTSLHAEGLGIKSIEYLSAYMPELQSLYIDDNELTALDISGFQKLRRVYACNNMIRNFSVGEKNSMEILLISNNELTSLPLDRMPSLSTLECSNNSIEVLYPNACKYLSKLVCSGNSLTELHLDQLSHLSTLSISDNRISAAGFSMPAGNSLTAFNAKNAFTGLETIDLSAHTRLRKVDVSHNKDLKRVVLPESATSLEYFYANDCSLNTGFKLGNEASMNWTSLIEVDLSNNPELAVEVGYYPDSYKELRKINVSGCDVKDVFFGIGLTKPNQCKITFLGVGVPQRRTGSKVAVRVLDAWWFTKWDEWKDWPENIHTTYMIAVRNYQSMEVRAFYDEDEDRYLEGLSKDDIALREAMGETFYNYMKNKLRPDSLGYRALHTYNLAELAALEAANMEIVDLGGILKYMPKVKEVNAAGNELENVDIPVNGLKVLDLSNNSALQTLSAKYEGCAERINLSYSFIDDKILNVAALMAKRGALVANGDVGPKEIVLNIKSQSKSPKKITMLSTGRELDLQSCYASELKFSGKSITFHSARTSTCEMEKLLIENNEQPIELVFTTVDMALLWVNKWIDDNPNCKFTMRVETGNEEIDQKLNGMLSLINNATATGSVGKLTDEMKQMANNILLPYAFRGDVPKGIRFGEVLDEFGLHEKRTSDDTNMANAMGATLYEALKKEYAPDKEYLHVEDVKSITTLDCAGMNVANLAATLAYMPSVTRVNASGNPIRSMLVTARGIYDLSNGKVALDTLKFARKAISLDLTGTAINQNVLNEALKNVTTNLKVSSVGQWTIDEKQNKLGELTIPGSVNVYSSNIQTLKFKGLYLQMHGDLDDISISNLELDKNVTPSIIFKSADVALKFLADWSKGNASNQRFNMVLLGGNNSACATALSAFNTEAKAGRGFSAANKQLAVTAIIDCVAKDKFAAGAKFDDMLKELGYVATYEVYITGIGNKSTAINLLRNHCGYSLQEAKAMCENLPATASGFNTRADAEALRKAIVTARGAAIVLAEASIKPVQADEIRGYEVVLLGVGTSKLNVVKAVRDVCGLTLAEANTLCGSAPVVIATDMTQSEAEAIAAAIESAGGSVQVNAPLNAPKAIQADETRGYEVVLLGVGTSKLNVVNALRAVCGVTLVEASKLCSSAPVVIATDKTQSEAQAIAAEIESAGGSVQVNAPKNVQKSEFNVVLTSVGTNRINVVKAVKDACGLGLGVANDLTKSVPSTIAEQVSRSEAEAIKSAIENAGGTVRIE